VGRREPRAGVFALGKEISKGIAGLDSCRGGSSVSVFLLLIFFLIIIINNKKSQAVVGILTGGLCSLRDWIRWGLHPFSARRGLYCPDGFDLRSFFLLCLQVLDRKVSMERRVCPACRVRGRWPPGRHVALGKGGDAPASVGACWGARSWQQNRARGEEI